MPMPEESVGVEWRYGEVEKAESLRILPIIPYCMGSEVSLSDPGWRRWEGCRRKHPVAGRMEGD